MPNTKSNKRKHKNGARSSTSGKRKKKKRKSTDKGQTKVADDRQTQGK